MKPVRFHTPMKPVRFQTWFHTPMKPVRFLYPHCDPSCARACFFSSPLAPHRCTLQVVPCICVCAYSLPSSPAENLLSRSLLLAMATGPIGVRGDLVQRRRHHVFCVSRFHRWFHRGFIGGFIGPAIVLGMRGVSRGRGAGGAG